MHSIKVQAGAMGNPRNSADGAVLSHVGYSEAIFKGSGMLMNLGPVQVDTERGTMASHTCPVPCRSHCDLHMEQGLWSAGDLESSSISAT